MRRRLHWRKGLVGIAALGMLTLWGCDPPTAPTRDIILPATQPQGAQEEEPKPIRRKVPEV